MCGFIEAGLALATVGTFFQISQNTALAEQQGAEFKRQAENTIVENELRASDRRRQIAALEEEALSIYGANGITSRGTPTDHVSDIALNLGRELFNDDFNAQNRVGALSASASNAALSASNRNAGSLFNLGSTVLTAIPQIKA